MAAENLRKSEIKREELRETLECSQAETLRLEKSHELCERAKAELAAQVNDLLRTVTRRFKVCH